MLSLGPIVFFTYIVFEAEKQIQLGMYEHNYCYRSAVHFVCQNVRHLHTFTSFFTGAFIACVVFSPVGFLGLRIARLCVAAETISK